MTNAEARFNNSLRPRKPEGSLGRTAQDVHLDSHTAPNYELLATVRWWGNGGGGRGGGAQGVSVGGGTRREPSADNDGDKELTARGA